MRASQFLVSAFSACAIVAAATAPSQAQQQSRPSGPILTPLGTVPMEILLSKVTVTDMPKSFAFYTKIIGLKQAAALGQPAPTPPTESTFGEVGMSFSGTFADAFFDIVKSHTQNPTPDTASMTTIGFKVPDAPAVIRRAKDAGYEVIREAPVVGPGEMSIGMLRDPDGYRVEIIQAASYPQATR
jgi:lactoylglutathione lyase